MSNRRRGRPHTKRPAKHVPVTTQTLVQALQQSPVATVPPSGGAELAPSSPPQQDLAALDNFKRLPDDSLVRTKALHILAMRMAGATNAEIAKALDISERSIRQYVYLAGRHGWLAQSEHWADPADRLEYELSHKVVRNLDRALDDEACRPIDKDSVTVAVAKGTLFKKFGEAVGGSTQPNVLAIKIEMPTGAVEVARPGSTAGTPRFVEGETVDARVETVE